jgi:hypothetical protein
MPILVFESDETTPAKLKENFKSETGLDLILKNYQDENQSYHSFLMKYHRVRYQYFKHQIKALYSFSRYKDLIDLKNDLFYIYQLEIEVSYEGKILSEERYSDLIRFKLETKNKYDQVMPKIILLNKKLKRFQDDLTAEFKKQENELKAGIRKNGFFTDYNLCSEISYFLGKNDELNKIYSDVIQQYEFILQDFGPWFQEMDLKGFNDYPGFDDNSDFLTYIFHDLNSHKEMELYDLARIGNAWLEIKIDHQNYQELS